jgi:hypothetical protein
MDPRLTMQTRQGDVHRLTPSQGPSLVRGTPIVRWQKDSRPANSRPRTPRATSSGHRRYGQTLPDAALGGWPEPGRQVGSQGLAELGRRRPRWRCLPSPLSVCRATLCRVAHWLRRTGATMVLTRVASCWQEHAIAFARLPPGAMRRCTFRSSGCRQAGLTAAAHRSWRTGPGR